MFFFEASFLSKLIATVSEPGLDNSTSNIQEEEAPPHPPPSTEPSSPAISAVLNTVELLEQILLGLDLKTLLVAQRVSKDWNSTIMGSRKLQQKLFLVPATRAELSRLHIVEQRAHYDVDRERSILKPNVWQIDHRRQVSGGTQKPEEYLRLVVYNPLLLRQGDTTTSEGQQVLQLWQQPPSGTERGSEAFRAGDMVSSDRSRSPRSQFKTTTTESHYTWERMLLIQPAAHLDFQVLLGERMYGLSNLYKFSAQLKFGEFIDEAERACLRRLKMGCPSHFPPAVAESGWGGEEC